MNTFFKYAISAAVGGAVAGLLLDSKKSMFFGSLIGLGGYYIHQKEYEGCLESLKAERETEEAKKSNRLKNAGLYYESEFLKEEEENKEAAKALKEIDNTSLPLTYRIFNLIKHMCKSENIDDECDENYWNFEMIDGVFDIFSDSKNNPVYTMSHNNFNYMHVLNYHHNNRTFWKIAIQVPPYASKGPNASPKMSDYRNDINRLIDEFWKRNNLDSKYKRPKIEVEGYVVEASEDVVEATRDGEKCYYHYEVYRKIDESVYGQYASVKEDGTRLPDGLSQMVIKFNNDELNEDYRSVEQYIVLNFEIKEPGSDKKDKCIDKFKLIEFMKYLYGKNIYQVNGVDGKQWLLSFIFHPADDLGVIYTHDLTERISLILD